MKSVLSTLLLLSACGVDPGDTDNGTPVANAGSDIQQPANLAVELSGRASRDPDGDALRYFWSFEHLPPESFLSELAQPFSNNGDSSWQTTFQPDAVGLYVVELVVYDGQTASQPSYVIVNANAPTDGPVAVAGPDLVTSLGNNVTLDGSQSYDIGGASLSWNWHLVSIPPTSTLTAEDVVGSDTVQPTFTPDVFGDYTLLLVVSSGLAKSVPDAVTITVAGDNHRPEADAGEDIEDEDCTSITVECAGSDQEGHPLSYFWDIRSKPDGSEVTTSAFGDRTAPETTFFADEAGTYQISCSVFDGVDWSLPDVLTLELEDRAANSPPEVDAGNDRFTDAGDAVCTEVNGEYECEACAAVTVPLGNGASVSDPDGDPLKISWEALHEGALIEDAGAISTNTLITFSPTEPGECEDEDFDFRLVAEDCPGSIRQDTMEYNVTCCGIDPI